MIVLLQLCLHRLDSDEDGSEHEIAIASVSKARVQPTRETYAMRIAQKYTWVM